jgi:RNase P/RNase MRP subunit p30
MAIDVGVSAPDIEKIGSFENLAHQIGLTGIAVVGLIDQPLRDFTEAITVYKRANLTGKGTNTLRNQIERVRKKVTIVAAQVSTIDTTNWAAEDRRVDLLTLNPLKDYKLRETTACLASTSLTALELQIAPLLNYSGLRRSKILKAYREAVVTAVGAGMGLVLSSGATHPTGLRSPLAMMHIGMLLGIDRALAEKAVHELPTCIIERNMKKLSPEYVGSGVEIVRKGETR